MLLQAAEAGGEENSPTSRPELPLISGGADSAPALPPPTPQRFSPCAASTSASPPSAQARQVLLYALFLRSGGARACCSSVVGNSAVQEALWLGIKTVCSVQACGAGPAFV